MKVLCLTALLLFSSFVHAEPIPTKEVAIGINNVYVPDNFDSKTDAFVIVNGIFPNGCYKWGRAETKDVDAFTHEIKSIAVVSQGMCIMVLVPFQKQIQLGQYATGKHVLRFVNGDGTFLEKSLEIH